MNWDCIACASLRPCRYAAPLRGRPMQSAGYAPIEENCRCVVLTQTINHFTYQINQLETPRNFNNEWDIPAERPIIFCKMICNLRRVIQLGI
jgi:hypothetical protein